MKPLLVGEANPYGGDPYYALYPAPEGCAGWRLCTKVMGLSITEYLQRFERVNLCHRNWSMNLARERTHELQFERMKQWIAETEKALTPEPPPIILLGAKVCKAFGLNFCPMVAGSMQFNGKRFEPALGLFRYVILPHPSGLSRAWNEPGAYERARSVLREAGVL